MVPKNGYMEPPKRHLQQQSVYVPSEWMLQCWLPPPRHLGRNISPVDQLLQSFKEDTSRLTSFVEEWNFEKQWDAWHRARQKKNVPLNGGRNEPESFRSGIHLVTEHIPKKLLTESATSLSIKPISKRIRYDVVEEALQNRHARINLLKRDLRGIMLDLASDSVAQRLTIENLRNQLKIKQKQKEKEEIWKQSSLDREFEAERIVKDEALEKKIRQVEGIYSEEEKDIWRFSRELPTPLWKFDGRPVHPQELTSPLSRALITVTFQIPSMEKQTDSVTPRDREITSVTSKHVGVAALLKDKSRRFDQPGENLEDAQTVFLEGTRHLVKKPLVLGKVPTQELTLATSAFKKDLGNIKSSKPLTMREEDEEIINFFKYDMGTKVETYPRASSTQSATTLPSKVRSTWFQP